MTPSGEDVLASGDRAPDSRTSGERAPLPARPAEAAGPAWELVETGRYRPLRIRGSFPGRELG